MRNIDFIKQPWLKLERFILHLCYLAIRKKIKSRSYPKHIKEILLIRRNRLGDSINVLPIIEALKKNYPSIKISVLANEYNAEIFNYSDYINHVYCINEKWGLGRITLYFNPVIRKLRHQNFDLVIGLGGFASMLSQISYCIKGKYSIGPKSFEGNFNDLLFDLTVEKIKSKNNLHVDEMANIVRGAKLKLPKKLPFPKLNVSLINKKNWLAICPDVNRKESRYSIENYTQIIEYVISNQIARKVVLFLNSPKSPYIALTKYGAEFQDTNNLKEFIEKIAACRIALTAAGGSSHIASSLGLRVIVISGIKNQDFWRPYGKRIKVYENEKDINLISPIEINSSIKQFAKH
jgi:ADP-heptose:LPS heptosyltransferase